MRRLLLPFAFLLVAACHPSRNCGRPVGSEQVIAVSPQPDSIYLYTPAIIEGFDDLLQCVGA